MLSNHPFSILAGKNINKHIRVLCCALQINAATSSQWGTKVDLCQRGTPGSLLCKCSGGLVNVVRTHSQDLQTFLNFSSSNIKAKLGCEIISVFFYTDYII